MTHFQFPKHSFYFYLLLPFWFFSTYDSFQISIHFLLINTAILAFPCILISVMQPISINTFFHLSFPIYFHFSHATNFSCPIFCHLGFLFTYFASSISHNPSLSSLIIHHYHHHDS